MAFFVLFKPMFKALLTSILLIGFLNLNGQNLLDEEGMKTGHWVVEYPGGGRLYEADFVKGEPVGEMIRYYKNGAVRARMLFESGGEKSRVRLFYENGKPAAYGLYVNQAKDSVWTYYSEFDGSVRIRESYRDGKLDGFTRSYYANGEVSEEVEWKAGVKEGSWNQYYENGAPRLSGYYKNNMLHGSYEVYFPNNTPKIRGSYVENRSDGIWYYYDDTGNELYSLEYLNGVPADQEKYDMWIQDTLKKYEVVSEPELLQQF
jgi:antitoxin component YwqK of YwqJK toxin-antitoxin module